MYSICETQRLGISNSRPTLQLGRHIGNCRTFFETHRLTSVFWIFNAVLSSHPFNPDKLLSLVPVSVWRHLKRGLESRGEAFGGHIYVFCQYDQSRWVNFRRFSFGFLVLLSNRNGKGMINFSKRTWCEQSEIKESNLGVSTAFKAYEEENFKICDKLPLRLVKNGSNRRIRRCLSNRGTFFHPFRR